MIRPSYLAAISIVALLLLVPAAVAQQQQEGEEETTQDEEEDVVVSIRDDSFVPANAIVAAGTTVWWVNEGDSPHSVTADNGLFASGVVNPGESYWVTFDGQGTVTYHGTPEEMAGSVTVGVEGEEAGEPAIQQQSPHQERSTPEREREPAVQQQSPSQEQSTSGGEPAVQQQTARQERTATG